MVGVEGTGAYGAGLAAAPAGGRGRAGRGRPARPQDPPLAGQVRPGRRRGRRPGRPGRPRHRHPQGPRRRGGGAPRAAGGPPQRGRRRAPTPNARSRRCSSPPPTRCAASCASLGDRQLMAHLRRPAPRRRPERGAPPIRPPPSIALRALARRHQQLSAEIAELDALIDPAGRRRSTPPCSRSTASAPTSPANCWSPPATTPTGCAPRPRSPCSAASPRCPPRPGAPAPPAQPRRGPPGQRALYRIVLCRLRWDPRTRAYAERRTAEGLTKKEIIRCLKRYVAREVYTALLNPQPFLRPGQRLAPRRRSQACSARSAASDERR